MRHEDIQEMIDLLRESLDEDEIAATDENAEQADANTEPDTITRFHLSAYLDDDNTIEKTCRIACTRDQLNDLLYERRADVEEIEFSLGTLDAGGHELPDGTWDMGYSTYEMNSKQVEKAWNALLDIMSPYLA